MKIQATILEGYQMQGYKLTKGAIKKAMQGIEEQIKLRLFSIYDNVDKLREGAGIIGAVGFVTSLALKKDCVVLEGDVVDDSIKECIKAAVLAKESTLDFMQLDNKFMLSSSIVAFEYDENDLKIITDFEFGGFFFSNRGHKTNIKIMEEQNA